MEVNAFQDGRKAKLTVAVAVNTKETEIVGPVEHSTPHTFGLNESWNRTGE